MAYLNLFRSGSTAKVISQSLQSQDKLEGAQRVHISAKWLMRCGRDPHCVD